MTSIIVEYDKKPYTVNIEPDGTVEDLIRAFLAAIGSDDVKGWEVYWFRGVAIDREPLAKHTKVMDLLGRDPDSRFLIRPALFLH